MKYKIWLVNDDGCTFDCATFSNIKECLKWAHDRGEHYYVYINEIGNPPYYAEQYVCKNNRLKKLADI